MKGADMQTSNSTTDVPQDAAYQLCDDIREEGKRKWYTWSAWWCWGCMTFTGGDAAKRCGATIACPQVIERYKQMREKQL
jgi:hypothetical protein